MVKHKRRRATTKKATRSAPKRFFKNPQHTDAEVAKVWNPRKSRTENMEALGLVSDVNKKPSENASARGEVLEIFNIPQTDDLTKLATNPRRTPLSGEKQKYIAKLIAKYGNDFDAMGRDTKLNAQQLTAAKLEKMTAKFLALDQKHRTVPIPT